MWAIRSHAALTDLHLESCSVGDIGASTLAHALAVDPPLDQPYADRTSPFVLSPLPPQPPGKLNIAGHTLRMLWLNNNQIGDEGRWCFFIAAMCLRIQ